MSKDMIRFGRKIGLFTLLFSLLPGFACLCLYRAGEIRSFSTYLHKLDTEQLFGLAYSNYDKSYKFHMTDEVCQPQVLALGSSRIMQVKGTTVNHHYTFYNAGGAIQNIYELPLFVSRLHYNPEIIFVNIDHWWFNPAFEVERDSFTPDVFDKPALSLTKIGSLVNLFYEDLYAGKIRLSEFFTSEDIGLNAICKRNGFSVDGSRREYDLEQSPESGEDYNFHDTFSRIEEGNRRFQYGQKTDNTIIDAIEDFLGQCEARSIKVVAILPPFAPKVYQRMAESGNYGYMLQIFDLLTAVFDKYSGCAIYDFTNMAGMGVHNYDFEDGFHGSEIIYNEIIRNIRTQDSCMAHYFVTCEEIDRINSLYKAKNIRYHSFE